VYPYTVTDDRLGRNKKRKDNGKRIFPDKTLFTEVSQNSSVYLPQLFLSSTATFFVYYEEIKRELKRILVYGCRCNERLKVKSEVSTKYLHDSRTLGCVGDWNT
jgi:hypothetical protein